MSFVELTKVAKRIVETCIEVRPWEHVLIVTDSTVDRSVDLAMAAAVRGADAEAYILTIKPPEVPNEDPPPVMREALKGAEVYIMHMRYDIIHPFSIVGVIQDHGIRTCYMPALRTEQMLHPMIADIDFEDLCKWTTDVCERMYAHREMLRITDRLGSDFTVSIREGDLFSECGLCREPGTLGTQPCGGAEVTAEPGTANGRIVFEAYHMFGRLTEPIRMVVKSGDVREIEGGYEARILSRLFREKKADFLFHIGGPGTNPYARGPGYPELIEDKKTLGALHIGFGGGIRGGIESRMHTDGIIYKPTIMADDELVEKDGVIRVVPAYVEVTELGR